MNAPVVQSRVAAIVPCYRVKRHIEGVVESLRPFVDHVYVVDDACPECTGEHVRSVADPAFVTVLTHRENKGVGGATLTGYRQAAADGFDVLVKLDGDGQMDPRYIPALIAPIVAERADYAKGNRFFDLRTLDRMPGVRRFGNAVLSFVSKLSSGYWDLMDPTNGYTAIHAEVLRWLPLEKIEERYFFESDMLFRLGCVRAVVVDVPMPARYGDEESNLRVLRAAIEFPLKHVSRFGKRVVYSYFLRGFSAATMLLLAGISSLGFALAYGGYHWLHAKAAGVPAATGIVMLAALTALLGVQFLLGFLNADIANAPRDAIWPASARLPKD